VAEGDETNNNWPAAGGAQALDVRNLPVLDITLVPVSTTSGTGNVTSGNADSFMDTAKRVHPIPSYDAQVRATFSSTAVLAATGTGWDTALNEVTAQRTTDGSSRYYFGVVHVTYGSGVAGLGWIGYPVAIGWDYLPSGSSALAHEIGHNWGRLHTACSGGESGTDPAYPYAGGIIGVYGFDLWSSALKDKTTYKDLMSYCSPTWVSDYTYKHILSYRQSSGIGLKSFTLDAGAKEPCLLVWGLRREGRILLEPAFSILTRPSAPEPGPFTVEGLDETGGLVWSQSFDLMSTTHPTDPTSAGFCFAVPMPDELLGRISELRIVEAGQELAKSLPAAAAGKTAALSGAVATVAPLGGDAVSLSWDGSAAPVVMIRDLDTGSCLGFARNGSGRLATSSGHLELLLSDGVHTRVQQWSKE
jgi:hypothetical protein